MTRGCWNLLNFTGHAIPAQKLAATGAAGLIAWFNGLLLLLRYGGVRRAFVFDWVFANVAVVASSVFLCQSLALAFHRVDGLGRTGRHKFQS